ncbi:MAG: TIGR01777 family oxidoreductase [Elusimicrobia bacterium]|nr:TIGR01777 family oxidoreductase [Elusimicrobiota bacterium]MDE2314521.1 TIGR01777 family oxidoreductase [Elusimicrobiota bacterium]
MRIFIAGGTGFIGSRLSELLIQGGHSLVFLSRDPAKTRTDAPGAEILSWSDRGWPKALASAQAVVNLAGAGVAEGRWTAERKRVVLESRLNATRTLVSAMAGIEGGPKILINASAAGYYGPRDDEDIDEQQPAGADFLAQVCARWEEEAFKAREHGARVVILRIGVVLGPGGGALARMLLPFRLGLGGRLGSGRQWFPWIHIDDLAGLVGEAIKNPDLSGPVNAVAPQPATNAEFTRALGRVLGRPTVLPAPAFALKLLLGEMSGMLLTGQRLVPRAAQKAGYRFLFPKLDAALQDVLKK